MKLIPGQELNQLVWSNSYDEFTRTTKTNVQTIEHVVVGPKYIFSYKINPR